MPTRQKLLVTTALEETWGDDEHLCFLGKWCCLYSRKNVRNERTYEVLPYHWDNRKKKYADFQYLQLFNGTLIKELSVILNNIHDMNYSEKTWEIMIGYWLGQFTAIVFDRWTMIDYAVNQYGDNLETIVLNIKAESCVPNDSTDATELFFDDTWNHFISAKIIEQVTYIKVREESEPLVQKYNDEVCVDDLRGAMTLRVKSYVKSLFKKLNLSFLCSGTYVFSSTYLSLFNELKLNALLGWSAVYAKMPSVPSIDYNQKCRNWKIVDIKSNKFEEIARLLIPQFMPKSFLEGFKECREISVINEFSDKTKVIFTSNSHYSNDVFKSFMIDKVDKGARLVIGQHGGGALHKYNGGSAFDLAIADKYLSPGDGCKGDNIEDVGQLFAQQRYNKYNKKGPALLVTVTMPRYSFDLRSMAISGQMVEYFEDQFIFYESLTDNIKEQFIVRLYQSDYGWNYKQRWIDRFPDVKFDMSGKMNSSIRRSRLMIGTYAATTYNETLASNIPTIIYWNPEHWELSKESDPYFAELKRVGIFHDTPQSAARQVLKIWDNIDEWWYEEELQSVREIYCRAFAYRPKNLIERLKKVLVDEKDKCRA